MKLLLTSSGITNPSLEATLVELLGKPIAESTALFVPTGVYPFPGGAESAYRAVTGGYSSPTALGWKSLGILELTALPAIEEEAWVPAVQDADALLVWGGDPLFLANWMRRSGLADLIPKLRPEAVYVGVSAGSIAVASSFVESSTIPPRAIDQPLKSEEVVFTTSEGDVDGVLYAGHGLGLVDFAIIPHFDNPNHFAGYPPNVEEWAARIPSPTYAIDDQTAVKVTDGTVEVISEGTWKLFTPTSGEPGVVDQKG
jgi:dipeptidase E